MRPYQDGLLNFAAVTFTFVAGLWATSTNFFFPFVDASALPAGLLAGRNVTALSAEAFFEETVSFTALGFFATAMALTDVGFR